MNASPILDHAETESDLLAAFEVMRALRPMLRDARDFIERVQRMRPQGYRLLRARAGDTVLGLAGYRLEENLIYGRFVYIDDLVVAPDSRGTGLGARLLAEVDAIARGLRCDKLVLDTGLANNLAQRFYFRQGLLTGAIRFSKSY
jgi:ribosomal protein S18 acetylase RimI-like enzyme